jgi:hypothetical protein
VVSTRVIATLFNPLRRLIESPSKLGVSTVVSTTDAKTLEAFSAKLRNETDLDASRDDLVNAVKGTMHPAHVTLWLRPDPRAERDGSNELLASRYHHSETPTAL